MFSVSYDQPRRRHGIFRKFEERTGSQRNARNSKLRQLGFQCGGVVQLVRTPARHAEAAGSSPSLPPIVRCERRGDARCGVARRHYGDNESARRSDLFLRNDDAVRNHGRRDTARYCRRRRSQGSRRSFCLYFRRLRSGRCRGRPRAPRSGGIASTSTRASCESFRFAPVRRTASGTPRPLADQVTLTAALGSIRGIRHGGAQTGLHSADGITVHDRPRPINLVTASEPIQQRKVDQIPHARPLPIAQAPPACHPRSAPELLGEYLPGDATTKNEDNASEASAIRDTRPPTLWSSGGIGKNGSTRSHSGSGSNAAAITRSRYLTQEIRFQKFC